ncbi:MAG: AsnC family protein [Sedimenticolaceae bacterium]
MGLTNTQTHRAVDATDLALLQTIEDGLPLVEDPYGEIGRRLGLSEGEVLARLWLLQSSGIIKRFGVVVRHHELGYRANAMVVWDIPDEDVAEAGVRLGSQDCVTLCYRRPRRLPQWRYNLFTMIHGRDRDAVLRHVDELIEQLDLYDVPHEVLFSRRRFKQRGARYGTEKAIAVITGAGGGS